jgi:ubiquinone/menaquinone biosynthesis C-methylase UbiE
VKDRIKNSTSEISHGQFFDQQATTWHDDIRSGDLERLYQIFLDKIPELKMPILDAGSGTGILLPILSKFSTGVFPVYEVDLSLNMLIKNREYHRYQLSVEYIQANVRDIPFRVIQEFWRVLSPGGLLVILHLMGHDSLNSMHNRVGSAVKNDLLPSVNRLSAMLEFKNFSILHKEDNDDIFLLVARK